MTLFDSLKALAPDKVGALDAREWFATQHPRLGSRPAVKLSPELARVLAVPRRERSAEELAAIVELMHERYRLPTGTLALRPAQAVALYEAPLAGGLLAPIGVGHGKTALDLLMPLAMSSRIAVLLIPPGLREQLRREYLRWREHFRMPSIIIENFSYIVKGAPVLHVVPFSKFSRHEATTLLSQLKPDLIIVDEAHRLKHRQTATTSRVLRYFVEHLETRLCAWSGTLTARSIKDYAHLSALALREASPLPLDPQVVEEWALALDPSDWPAPRGALSRLGEDLREGFRRRLVESLGVVATTTGAVDASIFVAERTVSLPEPVARAIAGVKASWVRPDGEEFVEKLDVVRCAKELAAGFYYRWRFPRGEPDAVILRWLAARKAWHRELREKLSRRTEHLDSPLLCANAALRAATGYVGPLPIWRSETYSGWVAARDTVKPETEAVWVDEYLAKDAALWATKNRGVVWYEHDAFGERVAALAELPKFGAATERELLAEKGDRAVVASIKAHGTGRDGLQKLFSRCLVANPPSAGDAWEQLLGRLHRIGQAADEVQIEIYRHTDEYRDAFAKAKREASYIEGTLGASQKLLLAVCEFRLTSNNS